MKTFYDDYLNAQSDSPGHLILWKKGDFYEALFEGAKVLSRALDVTLTKRGKQFGVPVPMAGIPCHAKDQYLHILLTNGHSVVFIENDKTPCGRPMQNISKITLQDNKADEMFWKFVPKVYKYAAMDADGIWCVYCHEPRIEGQLWAYNADDIGDFKHEEIEAPRDTPTNQWKDTLIERPGT